MQSDTALLGVASAKDGALYNQMADSNPLKTKSENTSSYISSDITGKSPSKVKTVNEYLGSVNKDVKTFAQAYKSGETTKFKRLRFSDVNERQASEIYKLTGFDVSGYENSINKNGIDYIEKRHGANGAADSTMADINDVARIPYVIDNFDSVEFVYDDNGSQQFSQEYKDGENNMASILQFSKKIDGTVYVSEAVPDSKYKRYG